MACEGPWAGSRGPGLGDLHPGPPAAGLVTRRGCWSRGRCCGPQIPSPLCTLLLLSFFLALGPGLQGEDGRGSGNTPCIFYCLPRRPRAGKGGAPWPRFQQAAAPSPQRVNEILPVKPTTQKEERVFPEESGGNGGWLACVRFHRQEVSLVLDPQTKTQELETITALAGCEAGSESCTHSQVGTRTPCTSRAPQVHARRTGQHGTRSGEPRHHIPAVR